MYCLSWPLVFCKDLSWGPPLFFFGLKTSTEFIHSLPIPLPVWHWLHVTNPSLSMTPTLSVMDYSLPIPLLVWHRLHITNPSISMTPATHYQTLSVWDHLHIANPSLSMASTSHYQSRSQYDTDFQIFSYISLNSFTHNSMIPYGWTTRTT